MSSTRRQFLHTLGVVAVAAGVPGYWSRNGGPFPHPSTISSDASLAALPQQIRFGYAAIAWGGNDALAIREISELGFRGIQLRSNILKEYGARPKALRDLLSQHQLKMVALSSGTVGVSSGTAASEIEQHASNAKFVGDVGGYYLQVVDNARVAGREPVANDYLELGKRLTEIGKRCAHMGITLGYHNHTGGLGRGPADVDRVMAATDPRYVKLELDTAHFWQAGGDPAQAIRQYRDRLLFLHIKDAGTPVPGASSVKGSLCFTELGGGKVDLPAVFTALKEIGFHGWAIVELDDVCDNRRPPKEAALISKSYLESALKMKI
jgi:inosose dehydratase